MPSHPQNLEKNIADLHQRISNLESTEANLKAFIQQLQSEKKELLEKSLKSYEIEVLARKRVVEYFRSWGIFAVIITGLISFFGYNTINNITMKLEETISSRVNEKVDKTIEEITRQAIEDSEAIQLVRTDFSRSTSEFSTRYDNSLAIHRGDLDIIKTLNPGNQEEWKKSPFINFHRRTETLLKNTENINFQDWEARLKRLEGTAP